MIYTSLMIMINREGKIVIGVISEGNAVYPRVYGEHSNHNILNI